ncbi:MAG TPA: hypothetical protein VMJ93_16055 [Verrucomicrobiae bacterium]|nr:hypothetical protein [Verrucomicrobiae bacterium]
MHEESNDTELRERLSLIEKMIAEGRRTTESWGWTFVLWGVALYAAFAWSAVKESAWAWPVTALVAAAATILIASAKRGGQPSTSLSRAVGSIWIALGITMFVLFGGLAVSGRLSDPHVFAAALCAILGLANGACGLILRWKAQLACGAMWWLAAVGACFGTDNQSAIVLLAAIFLGQIVFGIYGMIAEARARKRRIPAHA